MKKLDLSSLSEQDLLDLQKQIKEEKERRNDIDLYKSTYGLYRPGMSNEEHEHWFEDLMKTIGQKLSPVDFAKAMACHSFSSSTAHEITPKLLFLCDILTGNYEIKISGEDSLYGATCRVKRNTHLVHPDDEEKRREYRALYDSFMSVISLYVSGIKEKEAVNAR